ncbi:hypothetical protein KL86DES1_10124 [uncultured Desulfovibrio sp.]|uniref:Uncharacterized protein n=1 Tax=uncultured Desulfovibrio sp. TaxID=167968 RepID=A0A212KXI0_9BACT|nr:hypothetical protein KL86DES1_10124 [uncultured Desulfovibrio sp.]VZH35337.1 conserved protein of unknown function [Desulfovibrio sp. 86]
MARLCLLAAQVLYAIVNWWKTRKNAERTTAVRDDPGSAWVSKFGGTDERKPQPGSDDAGGGGDK